MSNNTKPAGASIRVIRGGCWYGGASFCRAALRYRSEPGFRFDFLGFRPVIKVTERNVKQH